jgi:hypothetical protein
MAKSSLFLVIVLLMLLAACGGAPAEQPAAQIETAPSEVGALPNLTVYRSPT